jgi:hypothetical protein
VFLGLTEGCKRRLFAAFVADAEAHRDF